MARVIETNSFLVVHDWKASSGLIAGVQQIDLPRLGLLSAIVGAGVTSYRYDEINIPANGWNGARAGVASDLESACTLSNHAGQFLVAESGGYSAAVRRIFQIELANIPGPAGITATVVETMALPSPSPSAYEFEGMACRYLGENRYLVLIGKRGDSAAEPLGTLHWGIYTIGNPSIAWNTIPIGIEAPQFGLPHVDVQWRDITGLHIDEFLNIWASAAYDPSSSTYPFDSVVYHLGFVCIYAPKPADPPNPASCGAAAPTYTIGSIAAWPTVTPATRPSLVFDSNKVEGVETSSLTLSTATNTYLTAASEDENRPPQPNGVWWPILP